MPKRGEGGMGKFIIFFYFLNTCLDNFENANNTFSKTIKMLDGISVENYKAFEKANIKIKPITILLGANSIGKSSLMQLILLLKQTANFEGKYKSALKLNGKYVNLGEPENIFRNLDTDKQFKFNIKIELNSKFDKNYYFEDINRSLVRIQYEFLYVVKSQFLRHSKTKNVVSRINKVYDYLDNKNIPIILRAKDLKKEYKFYKKKATPLGKELSFTNDKMIGKKNETDSLIERIDIVALEHTYNFISKVKELDLNKISYKYDFSHDKSTNNIRLNSIKVYSNEGKLIIGYSYVKSKNGRLVHQIYSDLLDENILEKYRNAVGKKISFHLLSIEGASRFTRPGILDLDSNIFTEVFIDYLTRLVRPLISTLNEDLINYVSPLRAFPKRYYFLDEANFGTSLDTINGDNLTEILKSNPEIKKKVNNWLENFGFEVNVDKLRDVIHHLKVNQSGLKLDITDVGFGISQVLPVIVQGFLSGGNSLTLIEQPEIHLHPKMQAELADLFIDIVKSSDELKRNLLIETHSEYLLRRLRRRISEKTISSEDVAIYFIKKENKKTVIEEVNISEFGAFDWPKDFYDIEFEDTLAFFKNQPPTPKNSN